MTDACTRLSAPRRFGREVVAPDAAALAQALAPVLSPAALDAIGDGLEEVPEPEDEEPEDELSEEEERALWRETRGCERYHCDSEAP